MINDMAPGPFITLAAVPIQVGICNVLVIESRAELSADPWRFCHIESIIVALLAEMPMLFFEISTQNCRIGPRSRCKSHPALLVDYLHTLW